MPTLNIGPLNALIRECWIDAGNLRLCGPTPDWTARPTIHAIVIESVHVEEPHRRQGHFRRFLDAICSDPRFDMVVVEAVQNTHLAAALLSWGWDCEPAIMDFHLRKPA